MLPLFIRARARIRNIGRSEDQRLCDAVRRGSIQEVRALLQSSTIRNNAAARNNQALRIAASRGNLPIVQVLLTIDTVKQQAAALQNQALLQAAENGHVDVVAALLKVDVVKNYPLTLQDQNVYALFDSHSKQSVRGSQLILENLLSIPSIQQSMLENKEDKFVRLCKESHWFYNVATRNIELLGMTLAVALQGVDGHYSQYLRRYLADPQGFFLGTSSDLTERVKRLR